MIRKSLRATTIVLLILTMIFSSTATFASSNFDPFIKEKRSTELNINHLLLQPTPEFTEAEINPDFSGKNEDVNLYGNWLSNHIRSVIRTYKDGRVQLRIWNTGDPIDEYFGYIKINGSTERIYERHLRSGATVLEWDRPMTRVEDKITLDVNLRDGYVSKYYGPAIRMTIADHKKTASHPSTRNSARYRGTQRNLVMNHNYLKAVEMDIRDISRKFPDRRYNDALNEMYQYAKTISY